MRLELLALSLVCLSTPALAQDAQPDPKEGAEPDKKASQADKNRAAALAQIQGSGSQGWLERGWRWDGNIDLALGQSAKDKDELAFFGRLRGGITRVQEPVYLTLGAIADLSTATDPAFGLQFETLEMRSALQLQLGGTIDLGGTPTVHAALGWQIFAFEAQFRLDDEVQTLFFGKLRLPISWFYYALTR